MAEGKETFLEKIKHFMLTGGQEEIRTVHKHQQLRHSEKISLQRRGRCKSIIGRVASIAIPPCDEQNESRKRTNLEGFTAVITDGEGTLDLIFVGRRTVQGIHPGVILEVEGFLMEEASTNPSEADNPKKKMFNPRYSLIPSTETGPHPVTF